ncbi:acetylornithine and succinylornithine aminotransferase [Spizellomyces punctatus DAOM BR117]|uniref:acetylornithine transaminase n=1 Tax=Spizellomyces punctatus (strain DAOM BR117) TaxID=645134 RepID=A0A0L0H646_SPIPD|nr:acetylornithine and succinylornithine aminotransferase [Spizellomyces punctatus DAOM BR117]KNC96386.1 acetylornithine and succinylornithine aminotransferase [Spizellomyces punctatus DAOM BR117]|eukprot:XP_016604426.1 acetylornithine and succinylornithine aminotransferase [Spizellomyces punctatus DAOM BR117]
MNAFCTKSAISRVQSLVGTASQRSTLCRLSRNKPTPSYTGHARSLKSFCGHPSNAVRQYSVASSAPRPPTTGDSYEPEAPHADANAHPSTTTQLAEDAKYLLQLYPRPDVIFTKGEGCYLYDQAGRKFLDLNAGIAVNALGHGDKQVQEIISDQAGKLIHLSNLYHNEHAGKFAKMIVDSLPQTKEGNMGKGSKVFFCNSGTEANEAALKFGRKWGRRNIKAGETNTKTTVVSFSNAFHGRSMGALSATPTVKYQTPFMPLLPGFVSAPFNDIEAAKQLIDENVCAVIVEPVQGEGGIFPASQEFLHTLRSRCDEVGALLIFDEIQCGLGRTGKLFAYENYGVAPDILTLAKPLANGVPIGAVLLAPHVAEIIKPGDHGTTFGGSPFATRLGMSVFDRIRNPKFLSHVTEVGNYLKSQCEELANNSPLISQVRGIGLMVGLQLRGSVDPQLFIDLAREHGVLVISAGNNTIRLVPPLIITKEEVDKSIQVFESVISDMESYIAAGKDLKG